MFYIFKLVFFVVLRIGHRALGTLGKHSATKLQPQPWSLFFKNREALMKMVSILSHTKIPNYVAQIRRLCSVWCQEMHFIPLL